jgi:hypothetical protein
MEFRFNVTGAERKRLAGAISEILNAPMKYLGAPGFGYEVGGYTVDKSGTVSGKLNDSLLSALTERGFKPEQFSDTTFEEVPETADTPEGFDRLAIEIPADGFTPEKLENLKKLVDSKATLIKAALGTYDLPIETTEENLRFPWFSGDLDSDTVNAYVQFIAALCKTAKEKMRVTAKPQDNFENPRFTMRVWLIGLGMVGDDYKLARKLLLQNLTGNAAWRYGAPEKNTTGKAEDRANAGEETSAAATIPAEGETAPAADTGADSAEKSGTDHE